LIHSGERRRFKVTLGGQSIDLVFWMMMTFAIIILLVIPFEFTYSEAVQPVPAINYYDVRVISVMVEYSDWRDRSIPPLTFSDPVTTASAIAICLPAILLNRRIRNQGSTKSIRDAGLATLFGTIILTIFLVEGLPSAELEWLGQTFPVWKLFRFCTLVIVVLIFIPLMIRETSHRDFQREHRILAYIVVLIATLVPAGIVANFGGGLTYYRAISPSYQFWYEASITRVPWQSADQVNIAFAVFDLMNLLFGFIYTWLNFIYGFSILRYLRGGVSRRRVFLLGISSILIPFTTVYSMVMFDALNPIIIIPLPVLFILGTSLLAFSKPINTIPHSEFDNSQDTPTTGFAGAEDTISVPILYFIRSKLMGVKRRIAKLNGQS
jgi:hypothetical protein